MFEPIWTEMRKPKYHAGNSVVYKAMPNVYADFMRYYN